jgi:hypothetical protein
VIYGPVTGLAAAGNQLWTQNSPGLAGAAESDDDFGSSVAAANFGRGSHADLLVGVQGEDVGPIVDAGAVQVIYGSPAGLTAVGDKVWTQDSVGIRSRAEAGDFFGFSVAAGDFGKSGYTDAAVGSVFERVGSVGGLALSICCSDRLTA